MNNLGRVIEFHDKFDVEISDKPTILSDEMFEFRSKFMQEELDEFIDAFKNKNLELMADSLIDLVWVALGTADIMGMSDIWEDMFDEVYEANMSKVKAVSAEQSVRGKSYDIIKPDGWQEPDLKQFIKQSINTPVIK